MMLGRKRTSVMSINTNPDSPDRSIWQHLSCVGYTTIMMHMPLAKKANCSRAYHQPIRLTRRIHLAAFPLQSVPLLPAGGPPGNTCLLKSACLQKSNNGGRGNIFAVVAAHSLQADGPSGSTYQTGKALAFGKNSNSPLARSHLFHSNDSHISSVIRRKMVDAHLCRHQR